MIDLKLIPGLKGIYYADKNGNIYNKNRKPKKIHSDKDGYLITSIDNKAQKVHRLIAMAFLTNPENLPVVNHKNGNKKDNRVENLEWVSVKDNVQKAHLETGTRVAGVNTGEKATPVLAIQKETGEKFVFKSIASAARELNLTTSCVSRCISGERNETGGYIFKKTFLSPVYNVIPVPIERVHANSYNPNHVAPPEMELLYDSIKEDGYTQPIVCYRLENGEYEIVDGFHRYTVMLKHKDIYKRENGLLPVSVIDKPISERMASTIRHNRARGSHDIDLMSNIVAELVEMGKSNAWISKHLGMDPDEVLRLKQITGLASLFKENEFSKAWTPESE